MTDLAEDHALNNAMAYAFRGTHTPNGITLVERLGEAISRLATVAQQVAEAQSKLELAVSIRKTGPISACTHANGHEISLRPREALSVEASRECPCCAARLWISVPSVGMLLETAAFEGEPLAPDLDAVFTRRERQVLNILRSSRYPLRAGQLAALIWSDPHRTHDVRSALYRLRNKLRNSSWAIPFPEKGRGVRLVRVGGDPAKPIDDELDTPRHSPESAVA